MFRGAGGLTKSVQEVGMSVAISEECKNVDVGCDDDFAMLMKTRAKWVHGAPPCKTFSAARRNDDIAKVKILRTEERPQGFGGEATETANKLASRMLEMARGQMERGDFFSIENPLSSLMWQLKSYIKLAAEDGVRMVTIHQCMLGSSHKKATGVLTNAPWIEDVICDSSVRPHHHVPLMGLVEDFRTKDGGKVWYTELAAEYPEGLCNRWAKEFHMYGKKLSSELAESPQKRQKVTSESCLGSGRAGAGPVEPASGFLSRGQEPVVPATGRLHVPEGSGGAGAGPVEPVSRAVDSPGTNRLSRCSTKSGRAGAVRVEPDSNIQRGVPISSAKVAEYSIS